jgi:probable HAF family extracellular repeat protein
MLVHEGEEAFRWTAGTNVMGLGDLAGGAYLTNGRDVSADGSIVVGGGVSAEGYEAFRWMSATGMVGLGKLEGANFGTHGQATSADGSVIVGWAFLTSTAPFSTRAFRWTPDTGLVPLDESLGAFINTRAMDVSADGSVSVGFGETSRGYRALRWTEGAVVTALPPTPGGSTPDFAEGLSGDGRVIVGSTPSSAIVWDEFHGSREIATLLSIQGVDVGGWQLHVARLVSYDGLTMIGDGRDPSGQEVSWVARFDPGTFVPEPGAMVIAIVALIGVSALYLLRNSVET